MQEPKRQLSRHLSEKRDKDMWLQEYGERITDAEARGRFVLTLKERMRMDDEMFMFILVDCGAVRSPFELNTKGFKAVLAAFSGLGFERGAKVDHELKACFRESILQDIEQERREVGMDGSSVSSICRQVYGVDSVRWLRMDQLGELLRMIQMGWGEHSSDRRGQGIMPRL